jgi:hypothetical protein
MSVEELNSNDQFEMTWLEFVEACARIAFQLQTETIQFNKELLQQKEYEQYSLALKLEALCQMTQCLY